jgi:hypothetical protein
MSEVYLSARQLIVLDLDLELVLDRFYWDADSAATGFAFQGF